MRYAKTFVGTFYVDYIVCEFRQRPALNYDNESLQEEILLFGANIVWPWFSLILFGSSDDESSSVSINLKFYIDQIECEFQQILQRWIGDIR